MKEFSNAFKFKVGILGLFLVLYFIASVFNSQFWGNILSPINALFSSGILFLAYQNSNKTRKFRISLLLLSLAFACWAIADILWAVQYSLGGDPESSHAVWLFYSATNGFILLSVLVFIAKQLGSWYRIQLAADSLIICLLTLITIWVTYLNKDPSKIVAYLQLDYTSIVAVVTDILIGIGVFSWLLSVRSSKISFYFMMISYGTLTYVFADMLYYYLAFNELYIPNSLIDFIYILSFQMIAFGALWKIYRSSPSLNIEEVLNIGKSPKWAYLLIFPILIVLLDISRVIRVDLAPVDIISCLILIVLYAWVSKYAQLYKENERLLSNEKISNEILEQRIQEQVKELRFLANQDTLTTLFNRRHFLEIVEQRLQSIKKTDLLAIVIMDVDRFKTINDSLGHDAGDKVLTEISCRLTKWNNDKAIIARLGGDEFALLFIGKYTQQEIQLFCSQIMDLCKEPIQDVECEISVTLSAGIALYSKDTNDAKTLMKNADTAMYQAKAQGYNKYQFYNPAFSENINKQNKMQVLLRRSNIKKEFELFYQPQFSLPERKLVGAEALIRWRSNEYGYIPPDLFIPVAEELDHILEIGRWVIQETIRQTIKWNQTLPFKIKIGFNISTKQLNDENFFNLIRGLIVHSGLDTSWLDGEIAESAMINDEEKMHSLFSLFQRLGVSISIDDFGSGYTALSYLNQYAFDRIKIDKALVQNLTPNNAKDVAIIKAIVSMAKSYKVATIAQGVQTQEQLELLSKLGCEQAQGTLLGRPVSASEFERQFFGLK